MFLSYLQHNILHVLINNPRTAWPTKIVVPFFEFLGKFASDNHIIFQKMWILSYRTKHAQFQFRVHFLSLDILHFANLT